MNREIRILLVEDDEEDYIITRDIVAEVDHHKYSLDWVSSFEEGRKLILEKRHDVYLIDYKLGVETGLDLINYAIDNECEVPLILLTGMRDIDLDKKAMEAGASDYLVKGTITPELLDRSLRYSVEQSRHIQEIKKLNTELERRVTERTEALADAINQLAKSKSEVMNALQKEKELNELKSRFVTTASHEFRTPLGTILSSVSLIGKYNEPGDEEKRKKHIDRIRSAVTNLTEILNDFLSLGKLEEGIVRNTPVLFELDELVRSVIDELKSTVKEGQTIVFREPVGKIEVQLDRQLLKNALINILSNAIKYSPEGKEIEILMGRKNNSVEIAVQDHGIGIPEEDQHHLYERFFRAKNAGNIQGTGLGLNIVKKYVDLMKGTIRFNSKQNEGTTFVITLPENN